MCPCSRVPLWPSQEACLSFSKAQSCFILSVHLFQAAGDSWSSALRVPRLPLDSAGKSGDLCSVISVGGDRGSGQVFPTWVDSWAFLSHVQSFCLLTISLKTSTGPAVVASVGPCVWSWQTRRRLTAHLCSRDSCSQKSTDPFQCGSCAQSILRLTQTPCLGQVFNGC